MALNDDILSTAVRHEIGLHRLSNATVNKVLALLKRVDSRIIERLTRGGSDLSLARQRALLDDIRAIIDSAYTDATGQLHVSLDLLAEYEADVQRAMLQGTVPVQLDYVRPAAQQIIAAVNARPFQGRLLREWFTDLPADAFKRLRDSIRMGFVEGRTVDQMVRDIRGTRAMGYRDGILEINRRAATTTVRTAVAHTANAARDVFYSANAKLIKGVQWHSTLDNRTSAICRARDGMLFPADSGPRPPAHPNCRSGVVPVLKSWKELGLKSPPTGTRASMNGQVPADLTYDAWLRTQPKALQDEILGVSKARLFRAGLTLDRYVSIAGDEYTLDELQRREADIWTRAFHTSS